MSFMDEYDDDKPASSFQFGFMLVMMAIFLIAVFGIVLFLNKDRLGLGQKHINTENTQMENTQINNGPTDSEQSDTAQTFDGSSTEASSKKTASDLGFWDMYPEESEKILQNDAAPEETRETEVTPETDGKHTKVTNRNGKEEWVTINNYLSKNSYDLTNLVCRGNIMEYYQDGNKTSYLGVDISKYNNYVDFNNLKNAGVQFVMIRLGARGYESGTITIDDYYLENVKRATDAGLNVGLYFYSQAITTEEAKEEVQTIKEQIGTYKISYPIAMDMEFAENDSSRIEKLSNEQKTSITKTFCDGIAELGYIPMIYGDKEWLIKEIQLARISEYDIWLSQAGDTPDYPYKFGMWQYSTNATIEGISGNANLNISFIDYSVK